MIKLGEPDHIDYEQSNSRNVHMSKVHSPSFPLVLPFWGHWCRMLETNVYTQGHSLWIISSILSFLYLIEQKNWDVGWMA